MWFYLHLANLSLAWYITKSAPLNRHYPKLQFSTYTWFSYAPSHLFKVTRSGKKMQSLKDVTINITPNQQANRNRQPAYLCRPPVSVLAPPAISDSTVSRFPCACGHCSASSSLMAETHRQTIRSYPIRLTVPPLTVQVYNQQLNFIEASFNLKLARLWTQISFAHLQF